MMGNLCSCLMLSMYNKWWEIYAISLMLSTYNKWWEMDETYLMLFKILEWELNSCWWTWIISVYFLVWVGFSILRVKMHARLFKCHWNSHSQSFFLNAFILLRAHNCFCVPFVLSHALHPPQLSNWGMGQLETHLRGKPRPTRNWPPSPSCSTAC
jgi:hypothetical protein